MKKQYIKQVEKELFLPRKVKKEIMRDLNEVFSSALEHGETEQQVIQRLGGPKEFADNTAEQFGVDNTTLKKRKGFQGQRSPGNLLHILGTGQSSGPRIGQVSKRQRPTYGN